MQILEAGFLVRIFDSEIVQINFEPVLRGKAGIHQVAVLGVPFMQAAIVEYFQIVLNDKGNDIVF